MKYMILMFSIFMVSASFGETLCPVNKNIAEDMRIPEEHFSKANAESALKLISEIVNDEKKPSDWTVVPNSMKIVEGYILRRAALNDESGVPEFDKSQFCLFMEKNAWWYD